MVSISGAQKKLTKEEIKKLIDESVKVEVWYDDEWNYYYAGDDQKKRPLLDMNFSLEHHKAHVIIVKHGKTSTNQKK